MLETLEVSSSTQSQKGLLLGYIINQRGYILARAYSKRPCECLVYLQHTVHICVQKFNACCEIRTKPKRFKHSEDVVVVHSVRSLLLIQGDEAYI